MAIKPITENGEVYYNGIIMPHVQVVYRSLCRLSCDWWINVKLDDGTACHIKVAAGFTFDGASIPRSLWRLCGHPLEAPRLAAALAHDWLYCAHVCDRKTADMIYRAILRALGIAWWRCTIEHAALRVAGGAAWKSHGSSAQTLARMRGFLELDGALQEAA